MKNVTLKILKTASAVSAALIVFSISALAGGICEEIGIVSSNGKIVVNTAEDCVEIEQLPYNHSGYSVNTDMIQSSLSADGYTFLYADADKNDVSLEYFTDGYVKAVNNTDADDVKYIPVKMRKSDEKAIDLAGFYFNNQGGSKTSSKTGIAGKSAEESAYTIIPPEGGSTKTEGVGASPGYDGAGNATSWTCEMNIYADGNTTLFANGRYLTDPSRNVFKWHPNGDVEINDSGTLRKVTTAERGEWHKLALSYSSVRKRVIVFLDGQLISVANAPYWTDISSFVYGTEAGNSDGICAFADGKAYIGYYYKDYYKRTEISSNSDSTVIEDNVIWTDLDANKSFETLKDTLNNVDKTELCGEYGENAKLVAAVGTDYTYYTVKNGLFADVKIAKDAQILGVEATVTNKLNTKKTGVMILSLKNSDGSVKKIIATDTEPVTSSGTAFTVEPLETDADGAEVIFITDWSDRTPLIHKVFKEEKE